MRASRYLAGFALCAAFGCGGSSMHQLNQLARDDLRCDHNLIVTKIDEKTRKVEGCGKSRTYVEICNAKDECSWVQDSGE